MLQYTAVLIDGANAETRQLKLQLVVGGTPAKAAPSTTRRVRDYGDASPEGEGVPIGVVDVQIRVKLVNAIPARTENGYHSHHQQRLHPELQQSFAVRAVEDDATGRRRTVALPVIAVDHESRATEHHVSSIRHEGERQWPESWMIDRSSHDIVSGWKGSQSGDTTGAGGVEADTPARVTDAPVNLALLARLELDEDAENPPRTVIDRQRVDASSLSCR